MASVKFQVSGPTGLSLSAIAIQVTAAGALSNRWDDVNQLWSANPTDSNAKIALAEQTGARAGYYHGSRAALGSYTGDIVVLFVDNTIGYAVASTPAYLSSGTELDVGGLIASIANLALQSTSTAIQAKTDLIVSGGATATAVTTVSTNVDTLLTRLSNTRAGYLDNLTNLDAAITTRAVAGDLMTLSSGSRSLIVDAIDAESVPLLAIHAKLPSTPYLTGTTNSAGAVNLDATIGDKNTFKADITTLATSAALATMQGNVTSILADTDILQTEWANGGRLDLILDTAAAAGTTPPSTADIVTAIDATSVKLNAVHAKLPSTPYLTGTTSVAGAVDLDATIGSKAAFMADVSALATAASLTTVGNNVTSIVNKLPSTPYITGTTNSAGAINLDAAIGDKNAFKADVSLLSTAANLAAVAGDVTSILADTNELQTDWVNGGRLDLIIDTVNATTAAAKADWDNGGRLDLLLDATLADTNELQTDLANGGRIDLLIDSILADTGELQTDWVNGGRLDLLLDATLADTNELQVAFTTGGDLETILQNMGASAAPPVYAPEQIPTERTWVLLNSSSNQTARNIINVAAGSSVYLQMDFSGLLADGTGISAASSAVDQTNPADITISDLKKSQDADSVIFKIAGLTAGKKHKIKVTCTTTDGQTLAGYGNVEVQ